MATVSQSIAGPGNFIRVTQEIPLAVTAVATTDFAPIAFPPGATDLTYRTYTTTGFGAATDAQLSLGSTAGGVDYVAATTIKAVGVKSHTPVDAAAAFHLAPGSLLAYPRITQSGTASATGAATLTISYSVPV